MADLDQLERALRNADAAGDTDAARQFAQEIKRLGTSAAQPVSGGLDRFGAGLADPIHGGAQLLTKMLPAGVVRVGNRLNNWLAENTGLVAALPPGGVDQQVREREAALKTEGMDWARLAGNVLSPVNAALAVAAPMKAAGLMGRVGLGAGAGAASAAMAPVGGEDFSGEKAAQIGLGAIGGGVVPAAAAGVGRMVSPKASVDPALALLKAEGVKPTVGQTLGGAFNRVEEKLGSVWGVGDMIRSAREGADKTLRVAVANRALEPIGQTLPKGVDGRDAVEYVGKTLGKGYDALLPKMTVQADPVFLSEVSSLRQLVNTGSIDPNAAKAFNRILQNDVMGKLRGQNALTGQTLKDVQADLFQKSSRMAASTDADQRLVGDALSEVDRALKDLLVRSNPQLAGELKALNTGWANFKRMQRAGSYVGAEDGAFNASNLQSAVKALDRSKDKARFSEGNALMQDLSDAAKSKLGNKVPNSGTADRLMTLPNVLATGAAFAQPMTLLGPAIGAGLYTPPAQALLRGMVSARPQGAQTVARLLNQTSPMLSPAGGLLGLQMMD